MRSLKAQKAELKRLNDHFNAVYEVAQRIAAAHISDQKPATRAHLAHEITGAILWFAHKAETRGKRARQ